MNKEHYSQIISNLANYLLSNGITKEFRDLAVEQSKQLTIDEIENLLSMLYESISEPPNYSVKKYGLTTWRSACQYAIFEIVFNLGENVLPYVRKIAWGKYDWIQGNAIELLIRFAANNIQRHEIMEEIKENYPKIRYEAQIYSIQPILDSLQTDDRFKSVLDELMTIEDFKDTYDELIDTPKSQ